MAEQLPGHDKFCRHCGYDLYSLSKNRCPECGNAFDPANPKTFLRHPPSESRQRLLKRIIAAVLVFLFLCSAAGFCLWYPWHREQAAVRMVQGYLPWAELTTKTIGPGWLQWMLGKRGRFLLQRVDHIWLHNSGATDADMASLKGLPYLRDLMLDFNAKLTDAALLHLKNMKQLQELEIAFMHVTDVGVGNLKDLKQLQELYLARTEVTDVGLVNLKNLTGLQTLVLDYTQVADAGLVNLTGMKQLRRLDLDHTQVTDAGMVNLKDLAQLRELDLDDTKVTDLGLVNLMNLKQLQILHLRNTKVTRLGEVGLKMALPNCQIDR